jgi:hypothetical protein
MPVEFSARSMRGRGPQLFRRFFFLFFVAFSFSSMLGQPQPSTRQQPVNTSEDDPEIAADKNPSADVIVDNKTILTVYQTIEVTLPKTGQKRSGNASSRWLGIRSFLPNRWHWCRARRGRRFQPAPES